MPRVAMKFGYIGTVFAGYAHQNIPDPPHTVEYSLLKALRTVLDKEDMELMDFFKEAGFKSGSRTDKGVSALGNVICFRSELPAEKAALEMNDIVKNCFIWGYQEVGEDFNPRYANSRSYTYHLPDTYGDEVTDEEVEEVVELFAGRHDFRNFSKSDPARPELGTVRELTHARAVREDGVIKLDFKARGYLWQMIRRIVWAIDRNLMGKMSVDEIKEALNGGGKERAGGGSLFTGGVAPPEPLVLMDVAYDKVKFNIIPGVKEKLTAQLWV